MLTKFSLALIVLLCCIFSNTTLAYADGIGFRMTPAVVEITIGENGKSTQEIILTNTGQRTIDLSIDIKPLVGAADSTVIYPTDQTASRATVSFLSESIIVTDGTKTITSLSLLPKQTKKISLEMNIKEFQTVSKHAFSVIVSVRNPIEHDSEEGRLSAESALNYAAALHVFVAGPTTSEGNVLINRFTTDAYPQKSPVDFYINLTNSASEYNKLKGEIIIRNIFNQIVGRVVIPEQIILAKQTVTPYSLKNNSKRATLQWTDPVLIGPYFATLTLSIDNTESITAETAFFVVPLIPVLIGAILLSVITLTIIRVKKRL